MIIFQKTLIFDFIALNQYINAERSNRFKAAKIKKDKTSEISYYFSKESPIINYPFDIHFVWCCKSKRSDPDNIVFQKKFILDGMVSSGFIKNDTFKEITGFKDDFKFTDFEGVELSLIIPSSIV